MSVLFEPMKIGKLEIANRFIRSATYYALSDDNGYISQANIDLVKELAANEVGLIVAGYAFVHNNGQIIADMDGIQDDDHIPSYKRMTSAVHDQGGKIMLQIVHGGPAAISAALRGGDYLAVSLVDNMPAAPRIPKVMNEEDINNLINAFGQAGRRVQEAGFDGVQIHGAHGYLVSQFLSPRTNQRTDRWGGTLENRMRFVIEVARAIKKQVDDNFPVTIKLGAFDYLDPVDIPYWGAGPGKKEEGSPVQNGLLTVQEGAQVARALEKEGVSLIEISNGFLGKSSYKIHLGITSPEKEAYFLKEAKVVREATSGPLSLVAGMRSLPVMEGIIKSGVVDFISICRPLIREPGLIKRWKEGDTRPADCVSCGGCFNYMGKGKYRIYCRKLKQANEA